ncbi:MAG: fatty acid desaturase [Pseudomonadota bacterium]
MASETSSRQARRQILGPEGPTWLALAGCYTLWAVTLWQAQVLGLLAMVPGALAVAFHSSLQHEIVHGHPTRNRLLNEALVFPALGLFIPYRRFRDLHLKHHNDQRLTDPYDDPESYYLEIADWWQRRGLLRVLLLWNQTFAGRMVLGPPLSLWALWRGDFARWRAGKRGIAGTYLRHVLGLVPVAAAIWASGMSPWLYVFGIAMPGMSLIMVRSYIEHRAETEVDHRTAIVDAHWFWRLLFLNNNFHAVHHAEPGLPWYKLRARWLDDQQGVLARNGGYYVPGYGAVLRWWLFTRREPVVHPFVGHDGPEDKRPVPAQIAREKAATS